MDKYKILMKLGDGSFGDVVKAVNRESYEVVAIKRMKKAYKSWEECIQLGEINTLHNLNHPNIVKLKEVIRQNDELFFVFEYLDGNLYEKIKDRNKLLPESKIRNMVYQILQALAFMHERGYFHRDMKPENLLVLNDTVKIADFGLARKIDAKPPFSTYVSTRWYRAPEVLLHAQTYNSAIDIWAVGVIMAELYSLKPLFPGSSEIDQLFKIGNVLGPPTMSSWPDGIKLSTLKQFKFPNIGPIHLSTILPNANNDAIDLMYDLLRYDPIKRPTAIEALRHPYFRVSIPQSIVLNTNYSDIASQRIKQEYQNSFPNNNNNNNKNQVNHSISTSNNNNNSKLTPPSNRNINPYLRNARFSSSSSSSSTTSSSQSSLSSSPLSSPSTSHITTTTTTTNTTTISPPLQTTNNNNNNNNSILISHSRNNSGGKIILNQTKQLPPPILIPPILSNNNNIILQINPLNNNNSNPNNNPNNNNNGNNTPSKL
ncbi:putative protein serine/threonine kinase [Cavenderia fasciculata]|uniref:Protein kinase domain-containing protein n=1 Tax=Cavenderia fasciculata TaxID=261658 RepID=F4PVV4_CACFS|nr:putative protein serine/threonine kinase [Cavenderia fasciculata]EGG20118.1 putative protein serine/threonine kinase [Cavenderia fasciculata]|eukprot:XP_004367101.1 putative protein serine/threonine kinase [Cavenderia fasciculata]